MSRPNFIVKVPSIPVRPKQKPKKTRRKSKNVSHELCDDLCSTGEATGCTRPSSYYSMDFLQSSDSKLKILETYDEVLSLKDIDEQPLWRASKNTLRSKENSHEGIFLLKQICADLNLTTDSDNDCSVLSLFQPNDAGCTNNDIRTAIVAQRILKTQEQISKSRRTSKTGLRRSSFNKSTKSLRTIDELPAVKSSLMSRSLVKSLSGLTSKLLRHKVATSEMEVQVNILLSSKEHHLVHSCNTQTGLSTANTSDQIIQVRNKTFNQHVQSALVFVKDKFVNTTKSSFYPNRERATQMLEHITENDLLCMEWIDRNLFRVPVNPHTVVVDEKIKESSEYTCMGSTYYEQELNWERQALCM